MSRLTNVTLPKANHEDLVIQITLQVTTKLVQHASLTFITNWQIRPMAHHDRLPLISDTQGDNAPSFVWSCIPNPSCHTKKWLKVKVFNKFIPIQYLMKVCVVAFLQ